jgi:soluble lytic murein transglycosylase
MKRLLVIALVVISILCSATGAYYFNHYWVHRFDPLIARQAAIYRLDPDLVWSIIYEETYFREWKRGKDGEIGLMQVTPVVAREWATETGMRDLAREVSSDPKAVLSDPERNIQIGCWYLEKLYEEYRDMPGPEARMVAGYNAGPSRVVAWNDSRGSSPLTTEQFIARIDIPSTRAYVSSILDRYQKLKAKKQQGQERAGK